jgi:hypothetical protein
MEEVIDMNAHVITYIETELRFVPLNFFVYGAINGIEFDRAMIDYQTDLQNEKRFAHGDMPMTFADYEPLHDGMQSNKNRMK